MMAQTFTHRSRIDDCYLVARPVVHNETRLPFGNLAQRQVLRLVRAKTYNPREPFLRYREMP